MNNIVKKYLRKKTDELNTLIRSSFDSWPQAQNKYIVKICMVQNSYWWLLPLFGKVLHTKLPFSQKLTPITPYFFHLKSFLWKRPLTINVRKISIDQILTYISFCLEILAHLGHLFA